MDQQSSRIRSLVERHLRSTDPAATVDQAVLMELISIVHRGGSVDVLNGIKETLKKGAPVLQLAILTLLDRLVQSTPPEFVFCLSTEDWTERLFRTAKNATAPEVADRIMVLVLEWFTRYPVDGLRGLVARFSNSKVLGERFAFLRADYERRRQQESGQQRWEGGDGNERAPAPRGALGSSPARPAARHQRVNLDTLLMDVQGDMAGLEYGIQHPDMLDPSTARDCAKHRQTLSKILDNPAHVISQEERATVLALMEQLVNLLSFHDALHGTDFAQGAGIATARARHVDVSPSAAADAAADADDEMDPDMRAAIRASLLQPQPDGEGHMIAPQTLLARQSSGAAPGAAGPPGVTFAAGAAAPPAGFHSTAEKLIEANQRADQLAVENSQLAARLRTAEAEQEDLRQEQRKAEEALEALKAKYATARSKNKEAVAATEQMDRDLEEAKMQIEALMNQVAEKSNVPMAPPEVREVVKVVKPKVDVVVVRRIQDGLIEARRGLHTLKREGRAMATVADQFVADILPRIDQIVRAAGVDREKDAAELRALQALYKREVQRRKQYYNQIQELKGNIRVYCRFRPMSESELKGGHTDIATFPTEDEVRIVDDKQRIKTYEFDSVFGANSTQEQVFADTLPLIDSVVDGYNVCIFAYGQTGSGKTHTMSGTSENPGINRRALERLFEVIREREDTEESKVVVSVLEIYNDNIRDLLVPKKNLAKSYDIHPNGKYGHYVSNLSEEEVASAESINEIMSRASANRTEGATNMNAHSSRSHMVVYILITTVNKQTGAQSYGKLSLVDLAGSERLDKSGAEGAAAKEAVAINKSLTALGDTIAALSQSAKHVPYRNSTLTHLLQDNMSGQAKVLMFCCCSPASYNTGETVSSLAFAQRARGVSLGQVKKNA